MSEEAKELLWVIATIVGLFLLICLIVFGLCALFPDRPAEAATVCPYGSWSEEASHLQGPGRDFLKLTDDERRRIIGRYKAVSGEQITAHTAYAENHWDDGVLNHSFVFVDGDCIQFRINSPELGLK